MVQPGKDAHHKLCVTNMAINYIYNVQRMEEDGKYTSYKQMQHRKKKMASEKKEENRERRVLCGRGCRRHEDEKIEEERD